jgi:hypothetical protein
LFTANYNPYEISLDNLATLNLKKDATVTVNDKPLNDLEEIKEFALQFTGLTEIEIPESVEKFGTDGDGKNDQCNKSTTNPDSPTALEEYGSSFTEKDNFRVFLGCTSLEKFTWKNAKQNVLGFNTFRGDNALEEVHFLTVNTIQDLADENIFFMCDMSKLTVYVTADSYNILVANGFGNENRQYSKLDVEGNVQFAFKESAKASDGYYYATYNNKVNSSWFNAAKFDVYSAVVEGAKVVLKPATAEEGTINGVSGKFYKVARFTGSNAKKALCVVRSTDVNAKPELNSNAGSDNLSTLPADNDLLYCANDGDAGGSKVSYVFKLGNNKGKVAFYRFKTGSFKANTIYIKKEAAARFDSMDIVIEGNTTGINTIEENLVNENAPVYNLQGVRVNGTKKGMYIKDGKKFMVK